VTLYSGHIGNTLLIRMDRYLRGGAMSWKECSVVDERIKFIARRLDGERMSDLCREFGISRKTGYKIWNRYQEWGIEALTDRSRRPYRYANQLPIQLEITILETKKSKPTWGAPKIRERIKKKVSRCTNSSN